MAKDLLARWPGIEEFELSALMDENILQGYSVIAPMKSDNNKTHYRCSVGGSAIRISDEHMWQKTCFNVDDVEMIESKRWYYKKSRPEEDKSESDQEWISCDSLSVRWGWSPFDVVALLTSGEIQFKNYWNHEPYVDGLNEFSIHKVDLLRWEAANADKIHNAPVLEEDGQRLREENKTFAANVSGLEAQNAALRSELERLKALPSGPPSHLEEAKAGNTAARWQGHLRTCLTLALHVLGEGRRFTTKELEQACSRLGCPTLTEDAMKIFRETMPPEHIHTGGRPKGKSSA